MFTAKSEMDLRLQVKDKFFSQYKVSLEDKRIDFLVYSPTSLFTSETFLWAESKKNITPVETMFTQLLLTIKKTVDDGEMPPRFLGVFDKEKIAFIEYHHILPVFNLNDFNWNEKPSTVSKKTENTVAKFLTKESLCCFEFKKDEAELREFIKTNFIVGNVSLYKAQINKNNFVTIYNKWIETVRPSINLRFEEFKKYDILDGDFFLADLLSKNNKSLYKKLKIFLRETHYSINIDKIEHLIKEVHFNDQGQAHKQFWEKYKRPPAEEYWQYMLERRDLLVPQKIRERKGSFFTPKIWVEKSQEYLEKAFGENWQDEYYIWDCCCGTANLLAGLTNPDRIWASTIDLPDVDIVHANIDEGFNLLKPHVFQFDFLNDEFIPQSKGGKVPDQLFKIISDPEKQKKLIIYMNPPYAEAPNTRTMMGTGENRPGIAMNKTYERYFDQLGKASREIFVLFFIRICNEIPLCKLASFSTLKYVSGFAFKTFRSHFRAGFQCGFVVLANTFDNVNGHFPIGFLIWDLEEKKQFKKITCDIIEHNRNLTAAYKSGTKGFYSYKNCRYINEWRSSFFKTGGTRIGYLRLSGLDMQNNKKNFFTTCPSANDIKTHLTADITKENLIEMSIYLTVRHIFEPNWCNNRDQFLYPADGYKKDKRFQNDCLIYALFHEKNKITTQDGINHWIPFTRKDVKGKDSFASTFMPDFLQTRGKFSKEAEAVFEAGKSLWKYYHETIKSDDNASVNASLYEIREYFKGRNNAGRMNTKATDEKFTELDKALKNSLKILAEQIQPKVYEYGFLLE